MSEFKFLQNFSQEKLKELSKIRLEPAWLSQRRLEAFERFQSLNWPAKTEEEWRRTDLNRLQNLDFGLEWSLSGQSQLVTNGGKSNGYLARLEQAETEKVKLSLSPEVPQNLVFTDLESAVRNYPD